MAKRKRTAARRKRAKAASIDITTKAGQVVALARRREGVSKAEIVKRLGISEPAADSLIADARRKVRLRRRGEWGASTWHA
jgi:DNA-binding CsgD family transcriptional regulator